MKQICFLVLLGFVSCNKNQDPWRVNFPTQVEYVNELPKKENFWIFILAGQSNMAGSGFVEPQDTIPSPRILTLNKKNQWVLAKEPLHYLEPGNMGLDCGLSFGKAILDNINDSIFIGLVPCAVGGTSVGQWLEDSVHRGVKLLSTFARAVAIASKVGTIKGVLWHQGENNSTKQGFVNYIQNLTQLFFNFRVICENDSLPILAGELGSFVNVAGGGSYADSVNLALKRISESDKNLFVINTEDLSHDGGFLHFDSRSLRLLGLRFADSLAVKSLK